MIPVLILLVLLIVFLLTGNIIGGSNIFRLTSNIITQDDNPNLSTYCNPVLFLDVICYTCYILHYFCSS
jgi:hypothetical protein